MAVDDPLLADSYEKPKGQAEQVQNVAAHTQTLEQKQAVWLLLVGVICGLLGFFFAALIGMRAFYDADDVVYYDGIEYEQQERVKANYLGERFKSRANYMPVSVSEMVSNPHSSEGKAFFAFSFIGALSILMSWYPWHLGNVHLGKPHLSSGLFGISWMIARQFFPVFGMILVICIPMPALVDRDFGDILTSNLHKFGAALMIGGYATCEVYTLICGKLVFKKREKSVRLALMVLCLASWLVFEVAGVVEPAPLFHLPDSTTPQSDACSDVYLLPSVADIETLRENIHLIPDISPEKRNAIMSYKSGIIGKAIDENKRLLYNTASGGCLTTKLVYFWFEVLACVFMLLNHLAIWWFAPERLLTPKALPDLP